MRPHFVDQSISLQSKNSKRHRKALAAVIQSAIECLEPRTLLTSIISGQTIAGAIAAQGNTAAYSFSAAVNDSFEVSLGDANSASAFEPLMHIFDPQGNEINASASHGTTNTNTSVRQFYQVPSGSGGNYTILVEDDTGTHTGAYDLELAIAPATQASDADGDGGTIATGQTKTGTINRTGDLDIFTFSAAQNNTFEVSLGDPNATSAFEPLMLIYDPHGDEINASASHGTDNTDTSVRQFFQVPTGDAGTYTIIVQDNGGNHTGAYDLELATAPATQVADADGDGGTIASGQTKAGTVNRPGDLDIFTFSAALNNTFIVSLGDANATSAFEPLMHIYDSQGNEINASASHGTSNTNTSVRQFHQVLAGTTGTYTIVVQGNATDNTGAYDLELAIAPATQTADADGDGGTIVSGQTKTGTINRTGDLDIFTFSAAANNTFEVSLGDPNASSTFEPLMNIYDPHGDEINASSSHGTNNTGTSVKQFLQVASGEDGVFTIVVEDNTGSQTGPYDLELATAPATQAADADADGGTIVSGQTKSGTINRPGDLDIFTFSAAAATTFEVSLGDPNAASTFESLMHIYDPQGNEINASSSHGTSNTNKSVQQFHTVVAGDAGTYTIVVQGNVGDNTGAYDLELATAPATQATDADNDGGSIASGQTKSGTINRPGDLDIFTFSAATGTTFEVSLGDANAASTFEPLMHIYDPQGNEINASASHGTFNTNTSIQQFYPVPSGAGGTYTVVVQGNAVDNIGAYDIELATAATTQATDADGDGGTITSGQNKSGTINRTGDLDIFTFFAAAGDSLTISSTVKTGTLNAEMFLYSPDGSFLRFDHSATTATVTASNISMSGIYTVVMQDTIGTGTGGYNLTLNDAAGTRSPSWLAPDSGAAYTLSGNTLTITAGIVSLISDPSATNPNLSIIVSAGARIDFDATGIIGSLTLNGSASASLLAGGHQVLRLTTLSLSATAVLDLSNNALAVDYTGASPIGSYNGTAYTGITGLLQTGRSANWTGPGIDSSAIGVSTQFAVGISEASTALGISGSQTTVWNGQTIDATTVLVQYVSTGDANLNRTVNLLDLNALATNFGKTGKNFAGGDFDFSGTVNIADFNLLAANFGVTLSLPSNAAPVLGAMLKTPVQSPFAESPISSDVLGQVDQTSPISILGS